MGRISRTLTLARSSWEVLKADKELALLPVISMIASAIIGASFILPVLLTAESTSFEPTTTHYVLFFVMYFVLAYVTIFFNAALIHGANERLSGGDPTLGSAIRGAMSRAGAILPWALLTATVSLILRAIEERAGIVGRIVVGLVGLAWTLITFLVVPILVIEGVGVGEAIKKSADMFKRTWGENMVANVGFGLIGFVAAIPGIALIYLGATQGTLVLIALAVLWIIFVSVIIATMSGIFQTALYRYAAHGTAGAAFDNAALASSFQPKHKGMFR